ncbi:type IV fimbrial biogenesis protein FimT [Tahibacter aquaticus]|jgi:type IV fimbrial biogenesis protein FimT|uniref:Type II secretion system protein H n=1 Tax=Tahibacter aquaticus TaxID=520092 RepID=A0A4R6YWA6_9GAMM|nr:GspH/FimT family pseudopilin [Tahibacter aquaticus]TDR43104.1 type IV fimbrial biogenesis protein FimT [Tahibacter aquaticus]
MSMFRFRLRTARLNRVAQRGFTLMELLITMAIAAILVGVALPSFRESMVRTAVTQTGNDIVLDLNTARAEAVKRGFNTAVIAKTPGNWTLGWEIWVDINGNGVFTEAGTDVLIRDHLRIDDPYRVLGAPRSGGAATQIVYNGTGAVNGGAYDFVVCRPNTPNGQNRAVLVGNNGTVSSQRKPPAGMAVSCPP